MQTPGLPYLGANWRGDLLAFRFISCTAPCRNQDPGLSHRDRIAGTNNTIKYILFTPSTDHHHIYYRLIIESLQVDDNLFLILVESETGNVF